MKCAIISSHRTLRTLLEEALGQAKIDFVSVLGKEAQDLGEFALFITDDQDVQQKYKNQPCFFIEMGDSFDAGKAQKIFSLPLKLGEISDEVIYYFKQAKIKKSLKPLTIGDYTLLPQKNEMVSKVRNFAVKLTDKEMEILLYIAQNNVKRVKRSDLLHNVWRYSEGVETHTLETHIYRLRQKIEKDPTNPQLLMTDEEGYYLNL